MAKGKNNFSLYKKVKKKRKGVHSKNASKGQNGSKNGIVTGKGFGKVVGVFPLIGTIMKERQLRSLIKSKQAIGEQASLIGDPTEFYRAQYKLMTKEQKKTFMKDLKDNGYNSLDEAIEAEVRINGFAPIQHMTDVGMFMHKAAEDRS